MNIVLVLCQEGERLDPESLIGHIAITDGRQVLREKHTYLDSWISGLIRGLRACRERGSCEIDLIDEPEPLIFEMSGDDVGIRSKGWTLNAGSYQSCAHTLRAAADLFLETVLEGSGDVANKALEDLRELVATV